MLSLWARGSVNIRRSLIYPIFYVYSHPSQASIFSGVAHSSLVFGRLLFAGIFHFKRLLSMIFLFCGEDLFGQIQFQMMQKYKT